MKIEIRGPGKQVRRYDSLKEALDIWDKTVENTLPGEKVMLVNADKDAIMSEYTNQSIGGQ